MRKEEKEYIKWLSHNIAERFYSSPPNSEEEIIREFGQPEEIVMGYYDSIDIEDCYGILKADKYKFVSFIVCCTIILLAGIYCLIGIIRIKGRAETYVEQCVETNGFIVEEILDEEEYDEDEKISSINSDSINDSNIS